MTLYSSNRDLLEMIRGEPSTLSGGQTEVFASRLLGTDMREELY